MDGLQKNCRAQFINTNERWLMNFFAPILLYSRCEIAKFQKCSFPIREKQENIHGNPMRTCLKRRFR